jgi:hypothetical protein
VNKLLSLASNKSISFTLPEDSFGAREVITVVKASIVTGLSICLLFTGFYAIFQDRVFIGIIKLLKSCLLFRNSML